VVIKTGRGYQAAVGSPDAHVKHLNEGGTVLGKQYLRIPTAAAQLGSGQDRNAGRSIRDIPGAFLQRTRTGKLWAMAPGPGGSVTFLYLLVRQVHHRPRHFLEATAKEMEPEMVSMGLEGVSALVRKANG
jgi:hypothetical protein